MRMFSRRSRRRIPNQTSPSPSGRRWRKAPDEGPSPAASRRHLPAGEGFARSAKLARKTFGCKCLLGWRHEIPVILPGKFRYMSPTMAGVMSTASGLVVGGDHEGNFMAFESRTGKRLWSYQTGSPIWGSAPSTYILDGRQYIIMTSGTTLVAFALPER